MTNNQIETSREVRLWLTQIVLPIAAVVMLIPESHNAVVTNVKKAMTSIKTKIKK